MWCQQKMVMVPGGEDVLTIMFFKIFILNKIIELWKIEKLAIN